MLDGKNITHILYLIYIHQQAKGTNQSKAKKKHISIPNPPPFNVNTVDTDVVTLNTTLTCFRGSSGVAGSDESNVLKPSASEGQARPGLVHPLLLYRPRSRTGPATAQNPRSKNKVNQNCSQTSPSKGHGTLTSIINQYSTYTR